MKLTLFGKEINVELPADPVAFVQEWALKILDAMGYSWPMTSTDVLEAWSARWRDLQQRLQGSLRLCCRL